MAYIAKLNIQNFRNYENIQLEFFQGLNFLYGNNGQGKTNILEAINFLSLLKSFRTNQIKDLLYWGKDQFFVGAVINDLDNQQDKLTLKVNISKTKQLFRNGYQVNQAVDFINSFQVISFLPEDINLIKGGSSLRRSLLNMDISKLYPDYLYALKNYNKLLKIRHNLFRKYNDFASLDKQYLKSFDDKLILYNQTIYQHRQKWLALFTKKLKKVSLSLFNSEDSLEINYKPSLNILLDDNFKKRSSSILEKNLERDYRFKVTHNGSHRDDLDFMFNGKKLSTYGSQGQCRLASLALKLTTAEVLFENLKNQNLIFLIDDVLGELDDNVKNIFFETMKKTQQVFITGTNKEILKNKSGSFFNIKEGKVVDS